MGFLSDTRNTGFVRQREAVGKAGWNPALAGKPQTVEDLKFANYFKEVFWTATHRSPASAARRLKNRAIGS